MIHLHRSRFGLVAGSGLLLVAVSIACSVAGLAGTPAPQATPIPKPTPTPIERITIAATKDEAISLALPDGTKVDIPIGALYQDDTATLAYANPRAEASNANFRIVGRPFEFEMQSKNTFADVVKMTIPFDASLLPPDVPEANVFAVGLVDDDWVRLRGMVDTDANTITVDTLLHGVYSWGYSTAANLGGTNRTYLDALLGQATTVGDAQSAVTTRFNQWSTRWDGCQITTEPFAGAIDPAAAPPTAGVAGQHAVKLRPGDATLKGLAGDPATLKIGDMTVGHYGGATIAGTAGNLYLSEVTDDNVLEMRCLLLSVESYARVEEASAVLDALQNPAKSDFFPDDTNLISEWVDVQKETNPDGTQPVDWTSSTFTDESVDEEILGGGDVRVTLTWGNTADIDLAVTDTEGTIIYYDNPTSSTGGQLDVDANGYCEEPLTTSPVENIFWPEGAAPEGEYLVQVAYSLECAGEGSTSYTVLVLNGSDVQKFDGTIGPGDFIDVITFER